MKKKLFVPVCIVCLLATGCSKDDVNSVKKTMRETVRSIKEEVEEYNMHKDIEVHSEEEMREFALNCMEEKYGKPFLIDETYCNYVHFNGHEDMPMVLYARAYPEGDEKDICGLFVEEPNTFKDNYSVKLYRHEIEDVIFPKMEQYDLEGEIEIDYPLMVGTIGDDLSAEDIMYDRNTCIDFFQPVDKEEDIREYIPLVRKWLDFLYTCDYEWYFALTDKENFYYQFIGISKGDHGYTTEEEWSDEQLLRVMEASISYSERHSK